MKLVFTRSETIAPGVVSFWFKPEARVRFEPGQFAEFRIAHGNADERGDAREFSISSLPDELLISLTTNFASARSSSFKRALQNLKPGDEVHMAEPMGDFVLPKDKTIPLVFVAAGIGCIPYATMVKWLFERDEKRTIQLIYGASRPEEFIFSELWQDYPLDLIPVMTKPTSDWHGERGRLTAERILDFIEPIENKLIYLAGPQSMIEPLFDDLLAAGLTRRQLLLDYFSGY